MTMEKSCPDCGYGCCSLDDSGACVGHCDHGIHRCETCGAPVDVSATFEGRFCEEHEPDDDDEGWQSLGNGLYMKVDAP